MNTIEVFFASGLNIAEAARALYLHRNTLVYRLDKFKKICRTDGNVRLVIALGYAKKDDRLRIKKRKSIEELVTRPEE